MQSFFARAAGLAVLLVFSFSARPADTMFFDLARQTAHIHRFSTLFTAHDVKNHLSTEAGRAEALDWCRASGVTKVYLESFRDGYQAERSALAQARDEFRKAAFEVSGCVTTTQVGKKSSGWNIIACYSDPQNQQRIKEIFEFTASLFDKIMIDDFWFTDCTCEACEAGRTSHTVTVGAKKFPVRGDSWEAYRCELMLRLSEENVLAAARKINPNATVIVKYPQWYDRFHERGYDVTRETVAFDRIWVGTETRDYTDARWGGTPQYEGYFIMRWLGEVGGRKTGGGWYDWLGTTEKTYVEQARQTILAGAKESLLFCYGGLQDSTGPVNVQALRNEFPELQRVAAEVQKRIALGVAAYKPANSHPEKEARIFDFVGMLGIPLLPTHEFPKDAAAAFFSVHALKDPNLKTQLSAYITSGRAVLMTDGLQRALGPFAEATASNVQILAVQNEPKRLLDFEQNEVARLRDPLLRTLGLRLSTPSRVAFYPFKDGSWVIENFRDDPVTVELNDDTIKIEARGWTMRWLPEAGASDPKF